jgi:hypothetical protein
MAHSASRNSVRFFNSSRLSNSFLSRQMAIATFASPCEKYPQGQNR